MSEVNADTDASGIRAVLAGLRFPTTRWQVIAQAQYWGASYACVDELIRLPLREYRSMHQIVSTLMQQRGSCHPIQPYVSTADRDVRLTGDRGRLRHLKTHHRAVRPAANPRVSARRTSAVS
jgi:hypothetical protein